MKRALKDKSGAAIVEFALIVPVFLTVIMGLMQYGTYFFVSLGMSSAIEVTGRASSISGTQNQDAYIRQMVNRYTLGIVPSDQLVIKPSTVQYSGSSGSVSVYQVTYPTPQLLFKLGSLGLPTSNTAMFTFRNEAYQ